MGLIIHGLPQSTCTQRVLATLAEKGVTDYEIRVVDVSKGAHKQEPHISLQPFGKVPVLEDNGLFVYESRAICKYLAAKYVDQGNAVAPKVGDLKGYALFEQACSIEQSYFDYPASQIAYERVFKGYTGGKADETKVAQYVTALETAFAGYEKILSKQAYLGGNEFSLADLFHLPYGSMLVKLGFQSVFDQFPAVKKWFEGLQARESWRKATNP